MKNTKILSFVAGVSLLASILVPVKASAASATMSLSGATQTSGTFSTIVYEAADGPVSSVKLAMNFSTAVTGVSYNYNVGPFTTTDPDGYHLSQGAVSGKQPVASVTFTLANPGSVTASVNTGSSVIKGTNEAKTAVVVYSVSPASATFTYNAPVVTTPPSNSGGSNQNNTSNNSSKPASNSTSTNKTTTTTTSTDTNGEVEGDTTTTPATTDDKKDTKSDDRDKKSDDKKDSAKNTSNKTGLGWSILAVVAVIGGFIFGRRYVAAKAAAKARADSAAAAAAAAQKQATKKAQSKGKSKPTTKKAKK